MTCGNQALQYIDLNPPPDGVVKELSIENSLSYPTAVVTDKTGMSYVFQLMQVSLSRIKTRLKLKHCVKCLSLYMAGSCARNLRQMF